MKPIYLFEFCEQAWIPAGARECLYEMMELCNSHLRTFNQEVAQTSLCIAKENAIGTVIELGAGRGPVTAELAQREDLAGVKLIACDLVPNIVAYQSLEQKYPDRVFPIYTPVDLTRPDLNLSDSVLVLSTSMHHIPFELRPLVLETLTNTNSKVAIFEPLVRSWLSVFLAALSFFPAFLLPLFFFKRPGKLRRLLWCWLIPIVPYMFAWDGVISCFRQWTVDEWQSAFGKLANPPKVEFQQGIHSFKMVWRGTHAIC